MFCIHNYRNIYKIGKFKPQYEFRCIESNETHNITTILSCEVLRKKNPQVVQNESYTQLTHRKACHVVLRVWRVPWSLHVKKQLASFSTEQLFVKNGRCCPIARQNCSMLYLIWPFTCGNLNIHTVTNQRPTLYFANYCM